MDFSNPAEPKMDGYFIPPSSGSLSEPGSFNRIGDNIFIEWDRNLIWAATDSGIYLITHPSLGRPNTSPQSVKQWALEGLNEGHDV